MSLIDTAVIGQGSSIKLAALGTFSFDLFYFIFHLGVHFSLLVRVESQSPKVFEVKFFWKMRVSNSPFSC